MAHRELGKMLSWWSLSYISKWLRTARSSVLKEPGVGFEQTVVMEKPVKTICSMALNFSDIVYCKGLPVRKIDLNNSSKSY